MKHFKRLKKAFGTDEYGMIAFPKKISNVKISRIQNSDKMGGCTYCFPHGIETTNSKWLKNTRNWKAYRHFQYKTTYMAKEVKPNVLKHNNFSGSIDYCVKENIYFGKILALSDLVTYEAKNKQQLRIAFIEAIYDYGLFKLMLREGRGKTVSFKEVFLALKELINYR